MNGKTGFCGGAGAERNERRERMRERMTANEMPANNSCKFYERKYNSNGH